MRVARSRSRSAHLCQVQDVGLGASMAFQDPSFRTNLSPLEARKEPAQRNGVGGDGEITGPSEDRQAGPRHAWAETKDSQGPVVRSCVVPRSEPHHLPNQWEVRMWLRFLQSTSLPNKGRPRLSEQNP